MANLIHLSQIKGGVKLFEDVESVLTSYNAYKVLTDISKGDGGNYNVNELLAALKVTQDLLTSDESTDGSIDYKIKAAKTDVDGKLNEILNKPVKDRVRIQGSRTSGDIVIDGDYESLVPNIDKLTKYAVYTLDNMPLQKEDGTPLKYDFTTNAFDGTPSIADPADKNSGDGVNYLPIDGDFSFKVFPIGTFTFATLPEDYLLDNDELTAANYQEAIDKIVVDLAQNAELIEAVKELVGSQAVQDQISAVVDALRVELASTTNGKGASLIGIEDTADVFTSETVQGAIFELEARLKAQESGGGQEVEDAKTSTITGPHATLQERLEAGETRYEAVKTEVESARGIHADVKTRLEAMEAATTVVDGKADANTAAISSEAERAKAEESRIDAKVDVNTQSITAEVERATLAETQLGGRLDTAEGSILQHSTEIAANTELIATKADDKFKTDMLTVNGLGGIKAGEDLNALSLQQVLTKLLYPYVAPVISASSTPNGGVYEKGTTQKVSAIKATVSKKSETIKSIEIFDGGDSLGSKTAEEVANGGTFNFTVDVDVTSDKNFQLKVIDNLDKAYTANTGGFTFVYPYYMGICDDGVEVNEDLVKSLTKKVETKGNKSYAATCNNQRVVFAFPASYGNIRQIFDPNNFDVTGTFQKSTVQVTGLDGTPQNYNVYVNGASTVANFTFRFNY